MHDESTIICLCVRGCLGYGGNCRWTNRDSDQDAHKHADYYADADGYSRILDAGADYGSSGDIHSYGNSDTNCYADYYADRDEDAYNHVNTHNYTHSNSRVYDSGSNGSACGYSRVVERN